MNFPKHFLDKCMYALDIQLNWEPKQGDICFYMSQYPIFGILCYDVSTKKLCFQEYDKPANLTFNKQNYIFLPRIDQLQHMIQEKFDYVSTIFDFKKWLITRVNRSKTSFYCPEEIWLEYMMDIKYKQVWHTNRWKKRK